MTNAIDCKYSINGDGPPLILIHGIGASRHAWSSLLPTLTPEFKVITYDLRGHGESLIPHSDETYRDFTLQDLVDDLAALQTKLGIEQAHIAGHSLGGMIGPAYARAYPDRVSSLGLLSTAAFRTDDDSKKVWSVVKAMQQDGIPNILPTLTHRWFTEKFMQEHPSIVEQRLAQVLETDPDVFLNVFRIYAGTEMSPWLSQVNAPSLVLTGEQDGGCNPRLNLQIAENLPNSELVILPELKHSILLEAGPAVAAQMVGFISTLT